MTKNRLVAAVHVRARDHAIAIVVHAGATPDAARVGTALADMTGAGVTHAHGIAALVGPTDAIVPRAASTGTPRCLIYP